MTTRSIRRAAERKANKLLRKSELASPAQLAANRVNAQFSTGPTTEAGKAVSSLNAVKSGLTGRTVLLPADDAAEYQASLQTYEDHFQPVGPEERALVQSLCDTRWRLNRIPGLEMAIYAQGRSEFADQFEDREESLRPSLIDLKTFLTYEKQIRNLQLQEARLVRRREKETAELHCLQQERLAKQKIEHEKTNHEEANQDCEPAIPSTIGFVFANGEIQHPLPHPEVPAGSPYRQIAA